MTKHNHPDDEAKSSPVTTRADLKGDADAKPDDETEGTVDLTTAAGTKVTTSEDNAEKLKGKGYS